MRSPRVLLLHAPRLVRLLGVAAEGRRQIFRHPLRSVLTAATSAVAIAVTVNVISLVYGLDQDLRQDVARFGRRTVDVGRLPVIAPGLERMPLGPDQVKEVEDALGGLDVTIATRRLVRGRARGDAEEDHLSFAAVPPAYLRTFDVSLAAGRFLEDADDPASVAVLDASVARALFPGVPLDRVIGRSIETTTTAGAGTRRVVGVLEDPIRYRGMFESFDEARGARTLTSGLLSFRNVYLPRHALGEGELAGVSVVAAREEDVGEIARRLRRLWPPRSSDPLLSLQSVGVFVRREWMDLFGQNTQTGAFLGNVVWIIVVGVAVIMLTTLALLTIRERYDELAIRRVEGATRSDVAWQVTVEGTILSLVGGLAGLPVGLVGAELLKRIVDFPFRFETRYALIATGVSVALGLAASVLPARRAASLEPARVLSRRLT